jgi:hypothetical protein
VRGCVQFEISENNELNMQANAPKIKPYISHIFFLKLGEVVGVSVICRDWRG